MLRKCFECVRVCFCFDTSEWIENDEKQQQKNVNNTRHNNNRNQMMPSRTLNHNTIICQMNVTCKWASHDM